MRKKRLLPVALSVCMAVTSVPVNVFASQDTAIEAEAEQEAGPEEEPSKKEEEQPEEEAGSNNEESEEESSDDQNNTKPSEEVKPSEETKPSDETKPSEEEKPSDENDETVKPSDETKPSESQDNNDPGNEDSDEDDPTIVPGDDETQEPEEVLPPASNALALPGEVELESESPSSEESDEEVPEETITIDDVNDADTLAEYLNQIEDGIATADGNNVILSSELNVSGDTRIYVPADVNLVVDSEASINVDFSAEIVEKFFESKGTVEVAAGGSLIFTAYSIIKTEYIGGDGAYFNLINGSAVLSDFDIDGNPFMLTLTEGSEAVCADEDTVLKPLSLLGKNAGLELTIEENAVLSVTGGVRGVSGSIPTRIFVNGILDCTEGKLSLALKSVMQVGESGKVIIGDEGFRGNELDETFEAYTHGNKNVTVAKGGVIVVLAAATGEDKNADLGNYIYNEGKTETLEASKTADAEGNVYYGTPQPEGGEIYAFSEEGIEAALSSDEVTTVYLKADGESGEVAVSALSIDDGKTVSVPEGVSLKLGSAAVKSILEGNGSAGVLSINAGASLYAERPAASSIALMSEGNDMLLVGTDDIADGSLDIQDGVMTVNGTLNMDADAEYTADMKLVVPSGSSLNIPILSRAQMAKKACEIVIEAGASVKYASYQLIGGTDPYMTLDSGEAVIELANAASGNPSLTLNGEATAIGALKALLVSSDAENIVPLDVVIESGGATVAERGSVYIPKNGTFTIAEGAYFTVKGVLTSSPNAAINVKGRMDLPLMSSDEIEEINSKVVISGVDAELNYAAYPVLGGEDAYISVDADSEVTMELSASKISLSMDKGAATINGNDKNELKSILVAEDGLIPFDIKLGGTATAEIPDGKTLSLTNGSSFTVTVDTASLDIADGGKIEIHSEAAFSGKSKVNGKVYVFATSDEAVKKGLSDAQFMVSDTGAVYSNFKLESRDAGKNIVVNESSVAITVPGEDGYTEESISSGTTTFKYRYATDNTQVQEPAVMLTLADGTVRRYERLKDAIANAEAGSVITLIDDVTAEAGDVIPAGVTLNVTGHKLTINNDALGFLTSKGQLVVDSTGSLELAGHLGGLWIGKQGSNAKIELTEGSVVLDFSTYKLSLKSGSKAEVPAGNSFNLNVGDGAAFLPIEGEIEDGAELTVNGTFRIPSRTGGNKLTVNGKMTVADGGKLEVGAKSSLTVGTAGVLDLPLMSKAEMSEIKGQLLVDAGAKINYANESITGEGAYLVMDQGSHATIDISNAAAEGGTIGITLDNGTARLGFDLKALFVATDGIVPVSVIIEDGAEFEISDDLMMSLPNGSSIDVKGLLTMGMNTTLHVHTQATLSGNVNLGDSGNIWLFGTVDTISGAKIKLDQAADGNGGVYTTTEMDLSSILNDGCVMIPEDGTFWDDGNGNITYFPYLWTYMEYTITLDAAGGEALSQTTFTTSGHVVPELPTPVKDGYTFLGWYSEDGTQLVKAGDEISGDMKLVAQWLESGEEPEEKTYTITFDAQGGKTDTTSMKTQDNGTLSSLPKAERSGYTFLGWFFKDGKDKITTSYVFTEDTTLYAHWQKNSSGNGGGSSSSGGGGGSYVGNSAVGVGVTLTGGNWSSDEQLRWRYVYSDGTYAANEWHSLVWNGKTEWYHFGAEGYLDSGWFTDTDGNTYYLHPAHDGNFGYMYTGWNVINGKNYFFSVNAGDGLPAGALFRNTVTPDGHRVGADGAWDGQPAA